MGKIKRLDNDTINKIAAGEVIEMPASCVKELVENSIDAGATSVAIEIKGAGRLLIQITDNGSGMSPEDALISLERHATSKIQSVEDLDVIKSMGFRGEALASIAAISEMTLLTAENRGTNELVDATYLEVKGGALTAKRSTRAFGGTTIQVNNLFFNVPARRKFQKSPTKDAQEIEKVATQIAIAHPEVELQLISDGDVVFRLPQIANNGIGQRISDIFGGDYFSKLHPIDVKSDLCHIYGFISDPSFTRSNRSEQYLFVNRRPVVSMPLSFAAKLGYGTAIEENKHPIFFLFVDIDPQEIDVNVHPQKREMRFHHETELKRAITWAVSSSLFSRPIPVQESLRSPNVHEGPFERHDKTFHAERQIPSIAREQQAKYVPATAQEFSFAPQAEKKHQVPFEIISSLDEFLILGLDPFQSDMLPKSLRGNGIYLCNFTRVLSRIAFEDLSQVENKKDKEKEVEMLAVPLMLEFPLPRFKRLVQMLPLLEGFGLKARQFGKASFIIDSIPLSLVEVDLKAFLDKLIDSEGYEEMTFGIDGGSIKKLARIASQSRKLVYPLNRALAERALLRLFLSDDPYHCPFGKPIFSLLSKEALEAIFS